MRRTLAKREDQYASEVRRLLDAALEVIRRCGTSSRPRVADIVAEAGLSNEAFYRHFRSKDALVTAILEDGGERLRSYLDHQLAKESTPEGQVWRWVRGVLAQADKEIAATTLAVLWNASALGGGPAAGRHFASAPLSSLLHEPFAALGSTGARARCRARRARHPRHALGLPVAAGPTDPRARSSASRRSACARSRPDPAVGPVAAPAGRTASGGPRPSVYANSSGTQLGARFSMNASIPSRGSGDSSSAQNIVW